MPIIPALGKLRREDELAASLGNMAKPCVKTSSPYKNQGTYGQTPAQLILPRGTSAGTAGRGTK